ncbi:MAG: hypothetical protein JO369_08650 [Paucibacter sp.]|nr:hypothetical protein [Roseateles sp.]
MRTRPNVIVAVLYALPAIAALGVWYTLLFVADGPATPRGILEYVLADAPEHSWFYWLLTAPALWTALAAAYLTSLAAKRLGAITLFCIGGALAVAAWITLAFEVALFASLPVFYTAWHAIGARR